MFFLSYFHQLPTHFKRQSGLDTVICISSALSPTPSRLVQYYVVYYSPIWLLTNALKQIEKGKQDDALSGLSNLLGELKDMAVDMGSEIERLVD